ncbi:ficolin-2-like [Dendronephthya gigantea]|uniref:ficolin-2-like n=1 Tax=Dendronephthya gigantea TaxID=151771 RepID=UPI00106DA71D|nr:ficolin-2-like [Dendronephthya gigantea]
MFKRITLLIVEIGCIIAQNCRSSIYNTIKTEGSSLPPDEIISSHTVKSGFVPIECYELCQNEPKCVGFNYRETLNVVNCQLTNITGKTDHNAMTGEGEWILMNGDSKPKKQQATSCAHLYNLGEIKDGVYTIDPDGSGSFQVRCDMSRDGGGWTVFQRRQDGSQDFFRGWSDYKAGFGNLSGEFWLGLDKIRRLTKSGQNVLRVDLMDFNNTEAYAKYENFSVADESDKYRLNIGNYSGDAGDSLTTWHNEMQFSTNDSDNDATADIHCAGDYKGGWWYKNCHSSNLNGLYQSTGRKNAVGISWYYWKSGHFSLKKTEMKMRPKQF